MPFFEPPPHPVPPEQAYVKWPGKETAAAAAQTAVLARHVLSVVSVYAAVVPAIVPPLQLYELQPGNFVGAFVTHAKDDSVVVSVPNETAAAVCVPPLQT